MGGGYTHTMQGALHHLRLAKYDLWQSGILRWQSCGNLLESMVQVEPLG